MQGQVAAFLYFAYMQHSVCLQKQEQLSNPDVFDDIAVCLFARYEPNQMPDQGTSKPISKLCWYQHHA